MSLNPINSYSQTNVYSNNQTLPPDLLTTACKTKDLTHVKTAVFKGARPEETTLSWAVVTENPEIVQAVISAGALPDHTTLSHAFNTRNRSIIDAVVMTGAKPNTDTFTCAIPMWDRAILKYALDLGARPDENSLFTAVIHAGSQKKNNFMINEIAFLGAKLTTNVSQTLHMALETHRCIEWTDIDRLVSMAPKLDDPKYDKELLTRAILRWLNGGGENSSQDRCQSYHDLVGLLQKLAKLGAKPADDSLKYAIRTRNSKVVQLIINQGAKVTKKEHLESAQSFANPNSGTRWQEYSPDSQEIFKIIKKHAK